MKRSLAVLTWLFLAAPAAATDAVLVGYLNPSVMPQFVGVWGWTDPATNRVYAFVGNNATGLYVVDATDPSNPFSVATVTAVPRSDMKTWSHYLYSVDGIANGAGGILDIAQPSSPVVVGSFSGGHNIFIDELGFMYETLPGLRIYDLKPNPASPALVYQLNVPEGHDVCVIHDRLYEFRASAGTFIWNVKNRRAPVLLGSITDPAITYHHNGWPTRDQGYLFITDEYAVHPVPDITVWDIHDLAAPFKVASIADPNATAHNCYVNGDLLLVAYYTAGFRVYNVSNPLQPVLADEFDTSAYSGEGNFNGAWGCYAFAPNNRVYINDRPNGLFIFELQGPTGARQPAPPAVTIFANLSNPFSDTTRLSYLLARGAPVTAEVYDVHGRRVRLLDSRWRDGGEHDLWWDGTDDRGARAASGVYYVRISAGAVIASHKVTLLR